MQKFLIYLCNLLCRFKNIPTNILVRNVLCTKYQHSMLFWSPHVLSCPSWSFPWHLFWQPPTESTLWHPETMTVLPNIEPAIGTFLFYTSSRIFLLLQVSLPSPDMRSWCPQANCFPKLCIGYFFWSQTTWEHVHKCQRKHQLLAHNQVNSQHCHLIGDIGSSRSFQQMCAFNLIIILSLSAKWLHVFENVLPRRGSTFQMPLH